MKISKLASYDDCKLQFIVKFANEIENRYQNSNLQAIDIASKLSMTEAELIKKTFQYLDSSPDCYLNEFRLNKAIELMEEGVSIQKIPENIGFSDQNNFHHNFLKRFHTEPSDFLNSVRLVQNII